MKTFLSTRPRLFPCLFAAAITAAAQTAASPAPQRVAVGANWALSLLGANTLLLGVGTILFLKWLKADKPDRFRPYFGDGQLVQLVVVLIVANNVLFLALMGVLGSSEVSAIYGGIVGYVLGRRAQSPAEGDHQPPPGPSPSVPAAT